MWTFELNCKWEKKNTPLIKSNMLILKGYPYPAWGFPGGGGGGGALHVCA